jgi:hypothetical protein
MSIPVVLWEFLRVRKRFGSLPIMLVLLIFSGLIVLTQEVRAVSSVRDSQAQENAGRPMGRPAPQACRRGRYFGRMLAPEVAPSPPELLVTLLFT